MLHYLGKWKPFDIEAQDQMNVAWHEPMTF